MNILASDGSVMTYGHLDPESVAVKVGSYVEKGQFLGRYADPATGNATGPHLHFDRKMPNGTVMKVSVDDAKTVMPNGRVTSDQGPRNLSLKGSSKNHAGIDIVDREDQDD